MQEPKLPEHDGIGVWRWCGQGLESHIARRDMADGGTVRGTRSLHRTPANFIPSATTLSRGWHSPTTTSFYPAGPTASSCGTPSTPQATQHPLHRGRRADHTHLCHSTGLAIALPRLLAPAASASGIWSTAQPLRGYSGQITRIPSRTSASTRSRHPLLGPRQLIDPSFSLIFAQAVSVDLARYCTLLTVEVPVIKTVLKFAANRIAFNPMEAMNLAVASEGRNPISISSKTR